MTLALRPTRNSLNTRHLYRHKVLDTKGSENRLSDFLSVLGGENVDEKLQGDYDIDWLINYIDKPAASHDG
jgi:hypothetical protein